MRANGSGIRVLVTGATGNVGRQVVAQLLAVGSRVRAVSRNPHAAGLPHGVEVVAGDLTRPETLDRSLEAIDSVFLVWTASAASVPSAINRIAQHAKRIVFLSSPYRHPHPLFQAAQPNPMSLMQAEIERLIRASGLAWTFLRPGMFAANARHWWAGQILAGDTVRWPYALSATAPIHERDIAAVAVRALLEETCAGEEYLLTGPESLTHLDQVLLIGEMLGRPLRFEEMTPDAWRRTLPPDVPEAVPNMLLAAWSAATGVPALITSTVADIAGTPPRTFRDWVRDNASAFR